MKKLLFLTLIKPYMLLLDGNGKELARRLDMEYKTYSYLLRGGAKYSDDYPKILKEAKKYYNEFQKGISNENARMKNNLKLLREIHENGVIVSPSSKLV